MAETIKGLNIKIGLDTNEIDARLKELNKNLKEQKAEMKAIDNALRFDPTNVSLWNQKQATLNQTLEQTKKKLADQNLKLEEAKKALEIGAISEEEFNQLKRGVMYTEAEVNKLNSQLDQTNKKIVALGNAKWDKLAKVGSSLTKYVTMPLIGATTALATLSVKSMQTADEIADNASKVYLSAEAYQEWSHACQILAVDQAQMQKVFIKTNAMLGDIASGNSQKVSEALALIGLTVEDLAGLDTDQAFSKLRDALSEVEDEATRTAVANEIFGDKLGGELAQVIGASAEQIETLRNETQELGIVTNEQAELAGQFTDQMDNVKITLQSVGVAIAMEVTPALMKLLDIAQNKIIPALRTFIDAWSELSKPIKVTIVAIGGIVTALGPVLALVGKLVPMIKTAVSAVKAFGVAKAGAVAGWAGLIAVIAIILLQNEKFRELLGRLFSIIGEIIDVLMDLINEVLNAIMPILEILLDLVNEIINILVDLINRILDPIIEVIELIMGLIESLIPVIKEIINELVNLLIPIIEIIMSILNPIIDIVKMIIDLVVLLIGAITELIDSVLGVIIEIIGVVADILSVVIEIIVQLIEIIGAVLQPILEIIIAILEPIIGLIGVVIEIIAVLMELLTPLITTLLQPILVILSAISEIFKLLSPLMEIVGAVIQAILVPALQILYSILEPLLAILNAVIDAIKWLLDSVGDVFDWFGDLFSDVGDWFSDTFNIGGGGSKSVTNNNSTNTTNNITVNTTSSKVDVDDLNRKLGGSYL